LAYREIANALKTPEGASDRYKRLDALDRLLDNSFFDDIAYAFEAEKIGSEYLPLTKRRPSVTYNLARIVVDQSSGSLWVDDEIAEIDAGSQQKNVDAIGDAIGYDAVFMEAYEKSASGSGAIIVSGSPGCEPMIEHVAGKFVQPLWSLTKPNTLDALQRVYPISKRDLVAAGVAIPANENGTPDDSSDDATFWMRVLYTPVAELRYAPLKAADFARLGQKKMPPAQGVYRWELASDAMGGVWPHGWGEVPAIYLRSLLFGRDTLDGRCAYADIADTQVEISRSLSQVGRGFRYSADPLIVRNDGEMARATIGIDPLAGNDSLRGPENALVRSASNVLNGDYSLLEPTGSGLLGTLEYVKLSREWALEVAGAMKADASDVKGAPMSGSALNKLEQMGRLLVKRQRIAYGTRGMIPFIQLILRGCRNNVIAIDGVSNADPNARLRLEWPKNEPVLPNSDPPTPVPSRVPPSPRNEE